MENRDGDSYRYSSDFQLATQMKSWMAINPAWGCVWDCVYCIQHKDQFFDTSNYRKINKIKIRGEPITNEEIISEIMVNPRITSTTPLIFYNFSDPFLPQNTKDLGEILTMLDKRKFTNIVGLITRTFADVDTMDIIAGLKYVKPLVVVSYSGYTNPLVERGPLTKRIELLKELKDRNIPTIQYLRPMVKEWIEKDQLKRTRDVIGNLVKGVVMSGIRLTPEIINKIEGRQLSVPKVPNFTNKFFPKDLQEEILDLYKSGPPVFRYTSCAVSSIFGVPDYNAHLGFFRETQKNKFSKCPLPCRECQKEKCEKFNEVDNHKIRSLLDRIGCQDTNFKMSPFGSIILDKELKKPDLTFLRHNTLCHVDFEGNYHHIDQVANMEVKSGK